MAYEPIQIKTIHPNNPYGEIVICGQPIISNTEPTSIELKVALWDGLLWAKPTGDNSFEFKIFMDGAFHPIGGGGSISNLSNLSYQIEEESSNNFSIGLLSGETILDSFYLDSSNTVKVTYEDGHFSFSCESPWFGNEMEYENALSSGIINEDTVCIVYDEDSEYNLPKETIYVNNLYILDRDSGEYIKVTP